MLRLFHDWPVEPHVLGGAREASFEATVGVGRTFGSKPPPPHNEVIDELTPAKVDANTPVNPEPPPPEPKPDDHVDVEMPVTAPTPPPAPTPTPPPAPPPIPPAAAAAFEAASAVRFDAGKARNTTAGKLSLKKLAAVLRDHPEMKITVTGHDKDAALAKKRADAVKWDLVDQGVAEDQADTATGEPAKTSITVGPR